ncbi:hypothetical protein P0M11_09025 [Kaistella sp. PBT33-4]|uniref:hypothetical protein n=1 Tax=Kaistella sp. PBT33-4 TaxID=3032000 RepID=UPI0023D842E0|nr:hypothetical protein [Kaistella sp. PBT33-4]MDF0720140.1 hypothetical protein [Kaistella sp. PBT33-4]
MKKIFYLPFMALVMLMSNSCSTSSDDIGSHDVTENVQKVNFNSLNDGDHGMGALHNKALELYYENNSDDGKISYADALIKMSEYMKEYDNSFFSDVDSQKLIEEYDNFKVYQNANMDANIKDGYFAETHDMLDYIKSKNEISSNNYDFLVTKVLIDEDFEVTLNEIDNYLANNNLSIYDRQQIETVKSIYISSNTYWETSPHSNSSVVAKGDPKSRAVIIADAVGGLIWASTGPFAVIGAAACSLIANEA